MLNAVGMLYYKVLKI